MQIGYGEKEGSQGLLGFDLSNWKNGIAIAEMWRTVGEADLGEEWGDCIGVCYIWEPVVRGEVRAG